MVAAPAGALARHDNDDPAKVQHLALEVARRETTCRLRECGPLPT